MEGGGGAGALARLGRGIVGNTLLFGNHLVSAIAAMLQYNGHDQNKESRHLVEDFLPN